MSRSKAYSTVVPEAFLESFAVALQTSSELVEDVAEFMTQVFLDSIEEDFAKRLLEAKELKMHMYDALHKRNAIAAKIASVSRSKKLKTSAKLVELRQHQLLVLQLLS